MNKTAPESMPHVDCLTPVAIAAIAICLNVAVHAGIHTLSSLVVGSHLQESYFVCFL